uniref:glycosyltransferase family 2 protein n=1 Tax=Campylobacter TaxID=194 RepID=UPI00112F8C15
KISIIIPVYNVEKYISQCLDSAINQSLKDIEIIIVDDCGSDKSMDIAQEYAKNDSRIKIIKNSQNMGLFLTRCEGIKSATGEYILNLDSDDFLDLRACEIAYNATKDGYYD